MLPGEDDLVAAARLGDSLSFLRLAMRPSPALFLAREGDGSLEGEGEREGNGEGERDGEGVAFGDGDGSGDGVKSSPTSSILRLSETAKDFLLDEEGEGVESSSS